MQRKIFLAIPAALFALAGCSGAAPGSSASASSGPVARVDLQPLDGSEVSGSVVFTPEFDGTEMRYAVSGLAAGPHGFHIHEVGSCADGSDGTPGGAAGGHFNPYGAPHGAPDATRDRRHVGDFGNILANASGEARGAIVDGMIEFSGPTSVIGLSVIVHGGADDLTSQPSGNAGPRVACGIIRAGS